MEDNPIASALGLPRSSDLDYVKRMFNLRIHQASKTRNNTLSLNTLRLCSSCVHYIAEKLSSIPEKNRPQELLWRKCVMVSELGSADESGSFEGAFGELIQVLNPTLNTISIQDRSNGPRMLGLNEITVMLRSFAKSQNIRHIEMSALHLGQSVNLVGNNQEPRPLVEMALGSAFENMFLQMRTSLKSVTLSRCFMDNAMLGNFAKALQCLTTNLDSITLEHCVFRTNTESRENLNGLLQALIQSSAQALTIQNCGLELPHITKILEEKSSLTLLDLSHDHSSTLFRFADSEETVRPFAKALAKAPCLTSLQLQCCRDMNDAVVGQVFAALEQNPRVQELNLVSGTFSTLDFWSTSLSNPGTGLVQLSVPQDLRKPQVAAVVRAALQQNTTLCRLFGSGRWRRPGAQIQQLLVRNQLLTLARKHQGLLSEKTALWPLILVKLMSNSSKSSESRLGLDTEMSPVYFFLLVSCAEIIN